MGANINTKNKTSNKNILLGSLIGYITIAVNIFFGIFSIPIIISSIGDSGYGLFTLATSVVNVFVIDFGLATAANHHLSKALADNNSEHYKDTIALVFKIYLLMDIVFGISILFIFLFSQSIFTGLTQEESLTFKNIFMIVGVFSLIALPSTIFNSILSSHEKFFFLKSINLLTRLLYIVVIFIVLFLGGGIYGLIVTHAVTETLCIIAKYLYVRFRLKTKILIFRKVPKDEVKIIVGFSIWACIQTICNRLSYNISPSILGITTNSKEIAIFGVIATFENYISMIASVMSGFFLARINRIKNNANSLKELEKLANFVGKVQAAVVFLVLTGFVTCGREFLELWINSTTSYRDVYMGTILICIPNLIFCPQLVYYSAMFTDKKSMKHLAICSIVKVILFFGLIFLLTSIWGAIGAATSILVSKSVEILLQNIFYKKDIGVNLKKFFSKVFLPIVLPTFLSLLIGLGIHFLDGITLYKFIKTFVMVTIIFTTFFLISLPKEERANYKKELLHLFKH